MCKMTRLFKEMQNKDKLMQIDSSDNAEGYQEGVRFCLTSYSKVHLIFLFVHVYARVFTQRCTSSP